eukprot:TRINITY_DN639_c0_g5_i1.p1 TRINITY_DN639_c0_g5~~TRINITY_DN639_c0_g5_i1.p1  ORF type:complete len:357 (+),score=71.43 TRINITY_DN639_c0_g5_i1:75-1073(+)
MGGSSVGAKIDIVVGGKNVSAIVGESPTEPPLTQPPSSLTYEVPISVIMAVLSNVNWPSYVLATSLIDYTGPITLVLLSQNNSVNLQEELKKIIVDKLSISFPGSSYSLESLSIIIESNIATISFKNESTPSVQTSPTPPSTTPPTPTASPASNIVNTTGVELYFDKDILLPRDSCKTYQWIVGSNVFSMYLYISLQTLPNPGVSLNISFQHGNDLHGQYMCYTPSIRDSNEYQLEWKGAGSSTFGSFSGFSASHPVANLCKNNLQFTGVWYAHLCSSSQSITYSFELSLIPKSTIKYTDTSSSSSSIHPSSFIRGVCYLMVVVMLVCVTST